jgi:hypothetical protein
MSPPFEFDIGTTTQTEVDENNHISSQIDHYGEENSGVPALESHHPYGFMGRHADPDVDADGVPVLGAQNLHAWEGNTGHTWPQEDPRVQLNLPALQPGETCWYGPAGQFGRMHLDGRITLYTTDDGTPTGRAIILQLRPKSADPTAGGLVFICPETTVKAGPCGFSAQHISGAKIACGSFTSPGVPSELGSFVTLEAAKVSINSPAVSLGVTSGAVNEASVLALTTLLTALGVVIAAAVDPTGIPTAAKTAFATALSTALPLLVNLGKNA